MDLADGHIILVAEACQALDMQLLVVSFPSLLQKVPILGVNFPKNGVRGKGQFGRREDTSRNVGS